mgnify:CR=1 FL=1
MYSREFCNIYNDYGWDYFSITMGDAILKYFQINNKIIKSHLDLGCGVGTLCNYFYSKNIKTTGIDISNDMISICKSKNNKINFFASDMIKYISKEKYDLITLTCDVINHILEEDKIEILFSNIYYMLNDDGYLIFDIYNKEKLALNKDIISNRDNGIKVHYYITKQNSLINTNVKVSQNDNLVYEYDVLEKLYETEFIKGLLTKYNFKIIKAENKILDERQRFEDKIYIICKKEVIR